MMCLMHQGQPYGHLTVGQKRVEADVLARMVGTTEKALRKTVRELEEVGVFTRTDTGIIYSRRMVRDEAVREARAAGGVKSLEHPNVPQRKEEGPSKGSGEGYPSPLSFGGSPSSSSSSSSSELKKKNNSSPAVNAPPCFADAKEESAPKIVETSDHDNESQADSEILRELPASGTVDDLFDMFWAEWPNKKHKKQARKAFAAIGPGVDLLREILKALERQQWDDGIPENQLPENWLSSHPWKDL